MVKRILLALVALPFALCAFAAQPTATLQSGDSFTPFYGEDAFVKAHEAASDGDVITLSPGFFKSTDITKPVKVIGAYAFSEKPAESTQFEAVTVIADDVTLEGIRFTSKLIIKAADKLTVSRSYMYLLLDSINGEDKYHDNTILTDCMVAEHRAMEFSKNAVLRNCCITYFKDYNETQYPALIENCNITCLMQYDSATEIPYAIYRNCALGIYDSRYYLPNNMKKYTFRSPCEFHNNLLILSHGRAYTEYFNIQISYDNCIAEGNVSKSIFNVAEFSKLPQYQTFSSYQFNAKNYGPENHKEFPAIPKIDSSSISTQTDSIGNLKVKIVATARD